MAPLTQIEITKLQEDLTSFREELDGYGRALFEQRDTLPSTPFPSDSTSNSESLGWDRPSPSNSTSNSESLGWDRLSLTSGEDESPRPVWTQQQLKQLDVVRALARNPSRLLPQRRGASKRGSQPTARLERARKRARSDDGVAGGPARRNEGGRDATPPAAAGAGNEAARKLERLRERAQAHGHAMDISKWRAVCKVRQSGDSAGTTDWYYKSPSGEVYRSVREYMAALGFEEPLHKRPSSFEYTGSPDNLVIICSGRVATVDVANRTVLPDGATKAMRMSKFIDECGRTSWKSWTAACHLYDREKKIVGPTVKTWRKQQRRQGGNGK